MVRRSARGIFGQAILEDRQIRHLIALGLLWAFGVTLMRGLRRPNDWAEAHWLISYDFGLVKRGLPGTLLKPFVAAVPAQAEPIITIVSFTITALFCVALLAFCWSILRRSVFSTTAVFIVAVVLTSPFVVMSGHLNGYTDGQIMLMSIAAVVLAWRGRMWLAALVLTVGLLVHETIFVIGLPTVLWAALLQTSRRRITWRQLIPLLLPLIAFVSLFIYQSYAIDAGKLESTLIAYLEGFPFIQHDQEVIVPRSFAKSFVDHFRAQSPRVWGRLFDPALMGSILPVVAVLILFTSGILRAGNIARQFRFASILLPFLPLSLHLIAWDTARIWTYPIFVGLLVVWVACQATDSDKLATFNSQALNIACLLILPLNIFGHIPLMDWRVERFPALWRVALYSPLALTLWLALAKRHTSEYTTVNHHIYLSDREWEE